MTLLRYFLLLAFHSVAAAVSAPFVDRRFSYGYLHNFAIVQTDFVRHYKDRLTSRYDKVIARAFSEADTNMDDRISFSECYSLVMKIYIYLNRQAPINPPTRPALRKLFISCDVNNNHAISREEFTALAHVLGRRAAFRLVTHKLVKMVGAPLFAVYTVRRLKHAQWLPKLAETIVPRPLQPRVLPVITSQTFCRAVLIVTFVSTLGNLVTGGVNYVLQQTLPEEDREEML